MKFRYIIALFWLVPILIGALTLVLTSATASVDTGELVTSYPLEDGGAIIIVYQSHDLLSELVVVRVNLAGDRDDLRRIGLSGELSSDVLTKVCGGRLHLTYSVDDEILHQTVDIPNAELGFLPLVCREAQ